MRLQGNAASNRVQWNLVGFQQLEKDTNSGLNRYEFRDQTVLIANLFVQDFLSELHPIFKGYTFLLNYHANFDYSQTLNDDNGFPTRPARIGFGSGALPGETEPKDIKVHYLGWGGDGHIGPINVTHQAYGRLRARDEQRDRRPGRRRHGRLRGPRALDRRRLGALQGLGPVGLGRQRP